MDLFAIPDDKFKRTRLLIKRELQTRGWQAKTLYESSSHILVARPDGKEILIYSSTPSSTSFAAAKLADDKYAAYELLKSCELPQLDMLIVGHDTDREQLESFLRQHGTVVVKPKEAAHGDGVTTGITMAEQLHAALEAARAAAGDGTPIIQKQYPHPDKIELRVLCIDYAFVGAILRQPARVTGDGQHTIKELIGMANEKPERGVQYVAPLAAINVPRALSYLGDQAESVPDDGEEVVVMDVVNYGAGGEVISVSGRLPEWLKRQSETVAKAFQLPVIGVDYILRADQLHENAAAGDLDAMILEVNKCPSLCIHDEPTSGEPQGAVKAFVDYLETL